MAVDTGVGVAVDVAAGVPVDVGAGVAVHAGDGVDDDPLQLDKANAIAQLPATRASEAK